MTRFYLCAALIAALSLGACQTGMQSSSGSDVTGIYYLAKVNGSPVPTTVFHDGVEMRIVSGTFIISKDGTCFSRMHFVPPDGTQATREVRAKYRLRDSRLTMDWENAGTTEGTVEGDTFIMDNEGMILEYTKNP